MSHSFSPGTMAKVVLLCGMLCALVSFVQTHLYTGNQDEESLDVENIKLRKEYDTKLEALTKRLDDYEVQLDQYKKEKAIDKERIKAFETNMSFYITIIKRFEKKLNTCLDKKKRIPAEDIETSTSVKDKREQTSNMSGSASTRSTLTTVQNMRVQDMASMAIAGPVKFCGSSLGGLKLHETQNMAYQMGQYKDVHACTLGAKRTPTNTSTYAQQVAFYAQLTWSLGGLGTNQTIVFDHVETNIGNGYSQYDGEFTAPANGVYVFIWTTANSDDSYMISSLVVNGVEKTRLFSVSQANNGLSSATGLVVLKINAGDMVWIRTEDHKGSLSGGNYSYFSGWLLY